MKKTDILCGIQGKLIESLDLAINDVKTEYKNRPNNLWVLDYSDMLVKKLHSIKNDDGNYSRYDFESLLNDTLNRYVRILEHVPEVDIGELHNLINVAGDLYELVRVREEAELSGLESKISKYDSSERLIKSEYDKCKAFKSKEEHQEWLTNFSSKLRIILDYIENLGEAFANKECPTWKDKIAWKAKLAIAKKFLKAKLGIHIDLPNLAEDVSVLKKSFLNEYKESENKLIESRYS